MLSRSTLHQKNNIAWHPTLRTIFTGNPVYAPGSASQQARGVPTKPQRNLSSGAPFGMSFDPGNNFSHLYSQSVELSASEAAARENLMLEVAKSECGFNPDHAAQLARLTGHMGVQRASSDPTLFQKLYGSIPDYARHSGVSIRLADYPSISSAAQATAKPAPDPYFGLQSANYESTPGKIWNTRQCNT